MTTEFTTLVQELRDLDLYLAVEADVQSGKVGVRMRIAPGVLAVAMPRLVVRPLVENAIRYGLAGKPGGGAVTIIAEDAGVEAVLTVEDDGVGMDPARVAERSGLGDVDERMRSAFGLEYALLVETAPDAGTKVTLRLPKG
ncbi:ATP-binding protein [Amycolatopsis sp. NPDC051071]|uniref:ATP-binding protein n=1 Tax=Amycolatopsis sp. NPDC051071 TaxID=3154637 RepID=UPI003443585E